MFPLVRGGFLVTAAQHVAGAVGDFFCVGGVGRAHVEILGQLAVDGGARKARHAAEFVELVHLLARSGLALFPAEPAPVVLVVVGPLAFAEARSAGGRPGEFVDQGHTGGDLDSRGPVSRAARLREPLAYHPGGGGARRPQGLGFF